MRSRRYVAVTDASTTSNLATTQSPTGTWTASLVSGGVLTCAAYRRGVWVVGGSAPRIRYSYDLSTWSAPSNINTSTGQFFGLAAGDDGYWVAGSDASVIRVTTDPAGTWTAPASHPFTAGVYCIERLGGYWLAAGGTTIAYATDPTGTWTAATLSPSSPGGNFNHQFGYDGTYWVKTCDNSTNQIFYATAPTGTWTAKSIGATGGVIRACLYANGIWVVGGTGEIWTATDPTGTWTKATTPGFTSFVLWLSYIDGLWVAGGSNGASAARIFTATDPTGTWTAPTSATIAGNYVMGIASVGGPGTVQTRNQAVNRAAVF